MNARAPITDPWAESNQRWLATEFARLHRRIKAQPDTEGEDCRADTPTPWRGGAGTEPALERVARTFGLSPFERDVLLLAAGHEVDRALRALLPPNLTFSLALTLLEAPHWDALSPQAPLRYWKMVELAPGVLPVHVPMAIDERMLHAITGVAAIDARLHGAVEMAAAAPAADDALAADVANALRGHRADARAVVLLAQVTSRRTRRDSAVAALHRCGWGAWLVPIGSLPGDVREADDFARRLDREAALSGSGVVVCGDATPESEARVVALVASLHCAVALTVDLDRARLRDAMSVHLMVVEGRHAEALPGDDPALRRALQQFRVDKAQLRDVLDDACACGLDPTDPGWAAAIWEGARRVARGGLDALAERIDAQATLDDLVLPAAQAEQLRVIATQLMHRHTVHEDWGFAHRGLRGLGLAVLFAGESGTGKTLAAEAIARAAGLDLYRVDLARTVSKYIGETEKNLARLFDSAEASGAVLLFDEADALFGKRSDVKDSHDRYANIEIAYLLQRIESYRGLAILTTNQKSALDKAFLRRIRFVVQFPFPDEAMRARLWRQQLPAMAPVDDIDYDALARISLPGGNIRAIALNAAFAAARCGSPIRQSLIVEAARAELAKLERSAAAGSVGSM